MNHVWIITDETSHKFLGVFASAEAAKESIEYSYQNVEGVVFEWKETSRVWWCKVKITQNTSDEIRVERTPIQFHRCHL